MIVDEPAKIEFEPLAEFDAHNNAPTPPPPTVTGKPTAVTGNATAGAAPNGETE